ncbi:glutamyl-tRNA(Gln) amidotransferase subunit C, mitochondrial [Apis florea]|uniref:glutamyl-tRNA(Gln) amidotransferase subunit C, mitochondrial n=1 Tax=Apis florea TaxID=7463 RepID=UPI0006292DD8|nr:glutamyl-tRNA(Gln) amidotransferase subunit C, mitochondrial [Apis florea]
MEIIRRTQQLSYIILPTFLNSISFHIKYIHSNSTIPIVTQEIIKKIGQLSLLKVDNDYSISVLKAAIIFTEHLHNTKIDNEIKPMYSPFEKKSILLRNDVVENHVSKQEILKNAAILEEEYFVTPLQTISKTQCK